MKRRFLTDPEASMLLSLHANDGLGCFESALALDGLDARCSSRCTDMYNLGYAGTESPEEFIEMLRKVGWIK